VIRKLLKQAYPQMSGANRKQLERQAAKVAWRKRDPEAIKRLTQ